jgi:hypothetical protein
MFMNLFFAATVEFVVGDELYRRLQLMNPKNKQP